MRKTIISTALTAAAVLAISGGLVTANEGDIELKEENFEDPRFRSYLSFAVDKDKDGILTPVEISSITEMDIYSMDIQSLKGIEHFTSLQILDCDVNPIGSVDLSHNTELKSLSMDQNMLTSLDLSANTKLEFIDLGNLYINEYGNKITSLVLGDKPDLKKLIASNNALSSIDLKGAPLLQELDLSGNGLKSLDVSGCPKLTTLIANSNNISGLDLTSTSVSYAELRGAGLKTIDVTGLPLTYLDISSNTLTTVDVSSLKSLTDLFVEQNKLTELNVSENTELIELFCSGNKIKTLDITNNPKIDSEFLSTDKNTLVITSPVKITVLQSENGSVKASVTTSNKGICVWDPITEAILQKNKQVKFTSVPDEGYVLKSWYINNKLVSSDPTYDFTPSGDTKVRAVFGTPTPTPSPTPSPTATPTPLPTSTPTPTPLPRDARKDIQGFVSRLYTEVLGRTPEKDGLKFWTDEIYSFNRSGGEVGLGFIFSDEFINRKTSDRQFVTILYKTFFDREPEKSGMDFWLGELKAGTSDRARVASGFVWSQEWADTCARYGIRSGVPSVKPTVRIEPSDKAEAFVERMYTTAMNRKSDASGLKFWSEALSNFEITGEQVGINFFLSDEFKGFKLSDKEFLIRLYKTFMDRKPEQQGYLFWLDQLKQGTPRENVVLGFTRSSEFVSKCIDARFLPYS